MREEDQRGGIAIIVLFFNSEVDGGKSGGKKRGRSFDKIRTTCFVVETTMGEVTTTTAQNTAAKRKVSNGGITQIFTCTAKTHTHKYTKTRKHEERGEGQANFRIIRG